MLLDELISEMEAIKAAASLKNASFGFPGDLIEIKQVHFTCEDRGHVGEQLHPDDYIKRVTQLYRDSWLLARIDHVIALLRLHQKAINACDLATGLLANTEKACQEARLDIQQAIQVCR